MWDCHGSTSYLERIRQKLFKAVNNVTQSANATQTARMFPGLSGVKDPLLKALPLSLKQEKGHKKEEGQSQEPNVHDPP